jgi:hypothetical protein
MTARVDDRVGEKQRLSPEQVGRGPRRDRSHRGPDRGAGHGAAESEAGDMSVMTDTADGRQRRGGGCVGYVSVHAPSECRVSGGV